MANVPAYTTDNIFVKIMEGAIPCHKVYEDEENFVFMDIMPRADGHMLVIPKSGARNLLDIDDGALSATIKTTRKMARAAMKALNADGITLQQFSEPAGGQEVFHLHFHIIPRQDGVGLKPPASIREDDAKLADLANLIKAAID